MFGMRNLRTELPSINSLCVFEAAARHMSFTRAADELFITQGGVSRQIRGLEEALGVALFVRVHRGLKLTNAGQELLDAVSHGLNHIAQAVRAIRAAPVAPQLTVGATVSFAYFWLMPRLAKFNAAHPEVDLRLLAADHDVDFSSGSIDVAIRWGDGDWPELDVTPMFGEEICAVCSPAYLAAHPELKTASDLLQADLLHVESQGDVWRHIVDWKAWLRHEGVTGSPRRRGMQFNTYPMVVQAAINGQGVALGWSYITNDFLRQGLLVRPVDTVLRTDLGYFLVSPSDSEAGADIAKFKSWVLAELDAAPLPGIGAPS